MILSTIMCLQNLPWYEASQLEVLFQRDQAMETARLLASWLDCDGEQSESGYLREHMEVLVGDLSLILLTTLIIHEEDCALLAELKARRDILISARLFGVEAT